MVEAQARAVAEARRRHMTMALAASVMALIAVGGSSAAYYLHQRQASIARAALALEEVRVLFNQAGEQSESIERWRAALATLHGAERHRAGAGQWRALAQLMDLKQLIEAGAEGARRNRALLVELSDTRTGKQDLGATAAELGYGAAFKHAGLDIDQLTPEQAAAMLESRPATVRAELAGYLDDWFSLRRSMRQAGTRCVKLLRTAQGIDPDPYRGRIRKALESADLTSQAAVLRELAKEPTAGQLPPSSATLLASAWSPPATRRRRSALLKRSVERHPSDLWVNYDLATYLKASTPSQPDEAIRYFTAARAPRPTSAHELAHTLEDRGRGPEAVAIFADLERRQPDLGSNAGCQGHAFLDMGLGEEAHAALERAVTAYGHRSPRSLATRRPTIIWRRRCTDWEELTKQLPRAGGRSSSSRICLSHTPRLVVS